MTLDFCHGGMADVDCPAQRASPGEVTCRLSILSGRGARPTDSAATGSTGTVRTPGTMEESMAHKRRRRERLLKELATGPLGSVGIFGAEICQVCGALDTYSGWAGAMAAHRHGIFVGPHHEHPPEAVEQARREPCRFCEICAHRDDVTELEKLGRATFVHRRCRGAVVTGRARRSYLDSVFADTDDLAQMADNLDELLADRRHSGPRGWAMSRSSTRAGLARRRLRRWLP